jgi:hypothetical protein
MALVSSVIAKCGKCGQKYLESANIGMLECNDLYYTDDLRVSLSIAADHRPIRHNGGRSTINWKEWVWTFDNNVSVPASLYRDLPRKPVHGAIVVVDEYNTMMKKHEERIIESEKRIGMMPKSSSMITSDDEGPFSYDSVDDSEEDDIPFATDTGLSQVIVARFDWRKKFSVIQRIKELDDIVVVEEKRSHMKADFYWNTEEYKHNPDLQLEFKLQMSRRFLR